MTEIKIKKIILVIICLLCLLSITSLSRATNNIMGVGIFYGKNITEAYYPKWHSSPNYKWDSIVVHPTYGWILSDIWELYFEGGIGYYNFKDTNVYSLDISLMTDYKILGPIYLEIGCGTGYWTNSPDKQLIKDGLIGFIKYGTGAKIQLNKRYIAKIGYRFTHSSEIFADDTGVNTHGILFSISKRF